MYSYRAFVYRFLSLAFSYPQEEGLEVLRGSRRDLSTSLEVLEIDFDPASLEVLLDPGQGCLQELQGEHNRLFATTAAAPCRETSYEADQTVRRAVELADISGFYQAFGLHLAASLEPDSLVAQLEFMALLLQKQLYARREQDEEGQQVCSQALESFLHDHLGRWYGLFALRLRGATEEPWYLKSSELLSAFMDGEIGTQGLQKSGVAPSSVP